MASKVSKKVSLSWAEAQGQYRKYVGFQLGRNGKRQPKCWYLGTDEREAIKRAVELVAEWNRLRKAGATVWPRIAAAAGPTNQNKDDFVDLSVLRVSDACDLFLENLRGLAEARQRSWSLVHSTEHRLTWIRTALGPFTPFSAIGEKEIQRAVLFLLRRPTAKVRNHQKSVPGPLAVKTVVNVVRQMKAVLNWVHETDGCNWNKPKRFDKLFRIRVESLKTAEERAREAREVVSGDVATFTIQELTALWTAAENKVRLFILLGLNCGFTSSEVSDVRTFEVFLDGETPHIHRRRNKTGIEAKWALWPETILLLRTRQAPQNGELRWLLTERGNPLVEVNARTRRDAIEKHWAKLVLEAKLDRHLGFRFLRKTGADAIKRLGGLEESEMYLSHQEPGINKAYANRNWSRMWECLRQLRQQLPFLGEGFSLARRNTEPPPPTRRSKTGFRNVSYHAAKERYYARVCVQGEIRCSGYFRTAEEAAAVVERLRRRAAISD